MIWIFLFHLVCTNGQKTDAITSIGNIQMASDFIRGMTLIKSFYDGSPEACIDWDTYPAAQCKLLIVKEMLVEETDLYLAEFPWWNK
jgi:hypothetical protein